MARHDPDSPERADGRAPAGRLGLGLRLLLFGSLALNLLVAGIVVGSLAAGRGGGDRPPRIGFDLGPLAAMLDPADRRAILREVRQTPGLRPAGPAQRRRGLEQVAGLLRAEPFDPAALAAILAAQREAGERVVSAAQEAFIAHLAAVGPAERARYADRLETELARRR